MKKAILSLSFLVSLTACKQEIDPNTVELKGSVKGLKQGTLYIHRLADSALVVVDSIRFDGKSDFTSKIVLESPEVLYLFLDRGQTRSIDNQLAVFAEPGSMTLETTLEHFYAKAKIEGSENHFLWEQYLKSISAYNNKNIDLIEQEFKAIRHKDEKKLDSIRNLIDKNLRKRYLQAINFALNHKDKEIAPYLALTEFYDANIKYLDTIQKSLSPEVATSRYGKMLEELISDRKTMEK